MKVSEKKILLAEDDPASLKILEALCKKWGFKVYTAEDGAKAWDIFKSEPDIHLIVSDWMMPVMDGIELCEKVRNARGRRYTYYLLLTAKTQLDDVISGLEAGADDFIQKPFNRHELEVRLRAGERILDLEDQLAGKIGEVNRAYQQMRRDLDAAASMQRSMLPPGNGEIMGVTYSSSYIPSEKISGDLFNFMELGKNRLGIYIFDVSGHGVPAALQSVAMGRMLSPYDPKASLLLRTSSQNGEVSVVPPRDVASQLNDRFQSAASKGDFITFLYGILDISDHTFTYTRAGHPAPVQVSKGAIHKSRDIGDIPIGIIPQYTFEENILQLNPGDRFYLFTDGISEALNSEGARFGEEKMLGVLTDNFKRSLDDSISSLMRGIKDWQGKDVGEDDMTILGFEMSP